MLGFSFEWIDVRIKKRWERRVDGREWGGCVLGILILIKNGFCFFFV